MAGEAPELIWAYLHIHAPIHRSNAISENLEKQFPWARIHSLTYPIQFDELGDVLNEILATQNGNRRGYGGGIGQSSTTDLVGDSAQMNEIRSMIDRVAGSMATVLITGESGTGKEVVARRLHHCSGRKGPFVAINCSAVPEGLLESELFGHERGAFTGAVSSRAGRFEMAEGGSIFLDEIGDMPMQMQVKLLRVLQERVVERVGGDRAVKIDTRVIAATHRDLEARIEDGHFREDLYYRLNVFPIEVPPLRERADDIGPLIHEMIRRVNVVHRIGVRLSNEAFRLLHDYSWPGNARELANLIERLAVTKPFGEIGENELPSPIRKVSDSTIAAPGVTDTGVTDAGIPEISREQGDTRLNINMKQHLADVERRLITSALEEANGVVAKAAEMLGTGRTTLVEKIKRYNISS